MKPCGIELFQRPLYLIFTQFGNAVSTLFFKMHPSIEKSAKSQTIAFSIVFPLTPHFRLFSVFQRISRLDSEVIVFRLSVFLEFTTLRGYENAPQLCIKIGVLIWRRKRDLNPRAGFPTYSLSRGAPSPLGYFSNGSVVSSQGCWRRGWDSNPRSLAGSLVFKTSSLNHSDTSPCMADTPIT